jgi:hypothetical protein
VFCKPPLAVRALSALRAEFAGGFTWFHGVTPVPSSELAPFSRNHPGGTVSAGVE